MTIPVIGHVVVLGYLATIIFSAVENAVVVGGLSALGAALYGIGVPEDSVLQYETAIKADGFLVMAHGTAADIEHAKTTLASTKPSQLDVHTGLQEEPADQFVQTGA